MRAVFTLHDSLELQITSGESLHLPKGYANTPDSLGSVGFAVTTRGFDSGSEASTPGLQPLSCTFLKPSQARAIASAILSAATEARG